MGASFAIFMLERYNFDGLRTGFCMMVQSMAMMAGNIWGIPFCNARFSLYTTVCVGSVINGAALIAAAFTERWELSVFCMMWVYLGMSLRGASNTAYLSTFSDASNRGAVFGVSQMLVNMGRMLGPVLATHLAGWYGAGTPFLMAGGLAIAQAGITWLVSVLYPAKKAPKPTLDRQETKFGVEWEDEFGSDEDIQALGRYVADLLSKRHYQWVSKRSQIESMLDHMLPELQTDDRETYQTNVASRFRRELMQ